MRRLRSRRVLSGLVALIVMVAGLVGAYSYGEAYSVHRGFVAVAQLARAGRGRLLNVNFYSHALHRMAYFLAYLPPGYTPKHRYPVDYLLHGSPGKPQVFINIANMDVRLDNQLAEHHLRPMILVFPDGRIAGSTFSDSEWANTPSGQFENYVVEVTHQVDHRFSTLRRRQARIIGGFSAGAYGALNIALHQLNTFGNVQVWSGYFTQSRSGVFAHASPAALAYNSPAVYIRRVAPRVARKRLRVYMFVGRDDRQSRLIVPMAQELARAGASVSYTIFPGGHDWQVWYPRLNQLLSQASQDASQPLPGRHLHGVQVRASARARAELLFWHRLRSIWVRHASRLGWHFPGAPTRRSPVHATAPPPAATSLIAPSAPHLGAAAPHLGAFAPHLGAAAPAVHRHRHHRQRDNLAGGLLLALISAAMINFGFLLQHRGLAGQQHRGARALLAALRNRTWLAGQAVGWTGFAAQILAVAIAPLSLVQAFAAGGLALSVPLAAGLFRIRIRRQQMVAIAVIALSLAVLPLGLTGLRGRVHTPLLIGTVLLALGAALPLALARRSTLRAIAAGMLYGVADAGIKAVSVAVSAHGASALVSGWTLLAALATFGGFLAFQAALRTDEAVPAISLMTAMTTLIALTCGVFAFGESLGRTPAVVLVHLVAIALVLACVPVLAGEPGEDAAESGAEYPEIERAAPRPARSATASPVAIARRAGVLLAGGAAALVCLVLSLLAGVGLLYAFRGAGWFAAGPRIPDALPLLQLAGFDGQPLVRVLVAWAAAGLVLGVLLARTRPAPRLLAVALFSLLLLLVASDASFALARNARFSQVLNDRVPPPGPWLEAGVLALACALPGLTTALPRVLRTGSRARLDDPLARGARP